MLYELPDKKKVTEEGLKAIKETGLRKVSWKEEDLENLLANNITQLIREEYLMTIFQERSRQEEPDILALDATGKLYIFELKRHKSQEENLLQVLRYGQKFGIYDYKRIERLFKKYQKGINSLQDTHKDYFDLENSIEKSDFNHEQKFVIVTAGLDFDTIRAIKYWDEKGLPVDSLIYKVYEISGKLIIDFDPYGATDEFDIFETSNHIVNTNIKYEPDTYKEMLKEEKASAYFGKKTAVDSIQKGDRVFLYHSGVGICAVGKAIDGVEMKEFHGVRDSEHFVSCKFIKKIDPEKEPEKALHAWEINQGLDLNWFFRNTRFSADDEIAKKLKRCF